MAIPTSGVNLDASTWFTINNKAVIFQDDVDNLDVGAMEYRQNELYTTSAAPYPLEIFIDQEQLHTRIPGYWIWRPVSYAGLYELRVKIPGYPDQVTKIRVAPQYFTQQLYQQMQEDLSNVAGDLLFNLVSSVSERVKSVKQLQDASALQEYRQVRTIVDKLGDVISAIRRDPYCVLTNKLEQRDWQEIGQLTGDCQAIGGDVVHVTRRSGNRTNALTLPTLWQVPQNMLSYDVYENRLLKQFLQKQLITKLNSIQKRAEDEIRQRKVILAYKRRNHFEDAEEEMQEITALERAFGNCEEMKSRCLRWSREAFLRTVEGDVSGSKATQVLLKHPNYSRFFKLYLQFQQQLQISLDAEDYITELGLRKIPELYEMWSVFEITRMAIDELKSNGFEPVSQSLFYEITKNSFHFNVYKNVASIVLAKDDKHVKIIYEPIYPNSALTRTEALVTTNGRNLPQTPDMAIELYVQGKPQRVCIFDAKYKRERQDSNGYFYPLVADIDKMRRYVANIRYQKYDPYRRDFKTARITASAYVLYPGNRVYEEVDDDTNERVGGIPLRPNMSDSLKDAARKKLNDILSHAGII